MSNKHGAGCRSRRSAFVNLDLRSRILADGRRTWVVRNNRSSGTSHYSLAEGGTGNWPANEHRTGRFAIRPPRGSRRISQNHHRPGDVAECFYDTFDAFNYAEHHQVPAIIVADKFLASTYKDIPLFDTDGMKVDRGDLLQEADLAKNPDYKRYQFTELGISPRARPGLKGGVFSTSADEHDEYGHITEAADLRVRMMTKRMN